MRHARARTTSVKPRAKRTSQGAYLAWKRKRVVELDGNDDNAVLLKYVWGPGTDGKLGGPGSLIALRDEEVAENHVCFSDGAGSLGQVVARSDGSVYAKYNYDGPVSRYSTDPCLNKPATFDDCDPCTGPCFVGWYVRLEPQPYPNGLMITGYRICSCGGDGIPGKRRRTDSPCVGSVG